MTFCPINSIYYHDIITNHNLKTMKINISIITLFLLISITLYSQNKTDDDFIIPKNSVFLNLNMPFFAPSVEYGRVLHAGSKGFLDGMAGIGSISFAGGVTLPHKLSFNFGKENSFLEVGIGGVYWNGTTNHSGYTERESSYNFGPLLGWRKYIKKQFFLRIYMNPLILPPVSNDFKDTYYILNTGFCFGYSF